jgi:Uma2 family endonuclease
MSVVSPPIGSPLEQQVVLHHVRWSTYQALLEDLGEHRGSRITYYRGTLEIMSPSDEHEYLKKLTGRLIEVFTEELDIRIRSAGSTTRQSQVREAGLEPDESYYIQNELRVRGKKVIDLTWDPPPDLCVEIDLRKSAIDRDAVYASLGIPEVWTHDGKSLRVRILDADGRYQPSETSAALPLLPIGEVSSFLDRRHLLDETALIREFRAWARERFSSA